MFVCISPSQDVSWTKETKVKLTDVVYEFRKKSFVPKICITAYFWLA